MHDRRTGQGKLVMDGGRSWYEGTFVEDLYEGKGEMLYPNGDRYKGGFSAGLKEGEGVLDKAENRSISTGTWKKDVMVGLGTTINMSVRSFKTPINLDGATALGRSGMPKLAGGTMSATSMKSLGEGLDAIMQKGTYTGPIDEGIPSGEEGVCKYGDGSEYSGEWKSGRRNGTGVLVFRNSDLFEGKWVGDVRSGQGKFTSVLLSDYDGVWEDNVPHGLGRQEMKDGSVYVGYFVEGKREGTGKLVVGESEEIFFEGEWANDGPLKSEIIML